MLKLVLRVLAVVAVMFWYSLPTYAGNSITITVTSNPAYTAGITSFTITYVNDRNLKLDWDYDATVQKVMIRAKYGAYPNDITDPATAPSDGYLVYYGTAKTFNDTSMDFDQNPGGLYYKAWAQKLDGTWYTTTSRGWKESKELILIALVILTLGLAIGGVMAKNTILTWMGVPMWIILGLYVNSNYTWLAEAQWVFILLGFGGAIGLAIETTTYRTKVEDEKLGDEISPEDQILVERNERYQQMMARMNKIMPRRHRGLTIFDKDDDE